MNLAQVCWQTLSQDDGRIAFTGISADGKIDWQRSRNEILSETSRWMAALRSAGIGPADQVVLSLKKTPALIAAHLAILALGAMVVPLNQSLTPAEVQVVLTGAKIKLAITESEMVARDANVINAINGPWWIGNAGNEELPKGTFNASQMLTDDLSQLEPIDRSDNDIALLLFTSGTTGKPKGVGLTHGNLLANLQVLLAQTWQITDSDRLLHALPPHHIHGLGLALYGSLLIGNSVVLLEKFDADTVLRAIGNHRITLFMGVPTMYHRFLEMADDYDLSSMRLFISGSAPLSAQDFHKFEERFGYTILERYGLTETLINSSNPLEGKRKPGSVGLPLAGVEIAIFDSQSDKQVTEVGEIRVRGDNVFPGYWQDNETTAEAFSQGWFCTGDLGHFDADGYLSIDGRIKELIIVGGSNVTPGEVEKVFITVDGVAECAVAGLPDADLGERIAAFIVSGPGVDPQDLEARLKSRAESELAAYKRPRAYYFIDALPRNAMGKIVRAGLRDLTTKGTK